MAQQRTSQAAQQAKVDDLQAAAALVMEKERKRKKRAARRARRRAQQREKEQLAAVRRMQHSVEVIKWAIMVIAGVMVLLIVFAIWTLNAVNKEVEQVRAYVDEIQTEVEHVRESLRNPMQSIGGAFGRELDAKLQSLIGNRIGSED